MNENEFWINLWKAVIGGVCIVVVVVSGSCSYSNYKIAEMVKNGADPIEARCALSADEGRSPICILAANRK